MISRIAICNDALSEIKAGSIQTIDDQTIEGRECRRHYRNIVDEMLEGGPGSHDWSFANRRASLALLAVNGRDREWRFAYALPSDCGTPIRILPGSAGWPCVADTETLEHPFLVEDGTIYSHVDKAILEYGINAVEESRLTQLVRRAISLDLAARLAMPVKGDRELKRELAMQAELAWERAIADDLNRHPRRQQAPASETLNVRSGAWPIA